MKFLAEKITSRSNPTVKFAYSLREKKGRDEAGAFIAEGEKLTYEAIEAGLPITHIFVAESKSERILNALRRYEANGACKDTEVLLLSDSAFEKISTEKAPQGIISVIKYLDFFREIDIIYKEEFFLGKGERAIILSSVRDPGNLGSVIRSAVAFGVDHIIFTADSADIYNPKTVRSAMGSLFRVKATKVKDICSLIHALKDQGRRVFAAELSNSAISLDSISLTAEDVVIIGNEGHGIDASVSAVCTNSVYIPISKKTESLNASVAAAIFMWEQGK
jgi:TrmH family RNA methyltransferase